MNQKYIITGAPGTGKTSLINELKKRNVSCSEEISREIIVEQIASDGDIVPWKNLQAFSERVAVLRKVQFENAPNNKLHFFDRSIIDVVAYMQVDKLCVPNNLKTDCEVLRYAEIVFYTPIWTDIYSTDSERMEDLAKAKTIEKEIISTYKTLKYQLIEVPKLPIGKRVDFILSKT